MFILLDTLYIYIHLYPHICPSNNNQNMLNKLIITKMCTQIYFRILLLLHIYINKTREKKIK